MPILVEPQLVTSERKHHDGAADDRAERGAEPAEQRRQLQLDRLREAERRFRIDRHVVLHVEHGGERGHRRADA